MAGRRWDYLNAAGAGDMESVAMLLATGVDPYVTDMDERNALHKAVIGGHFELFKMLLFEVGIDPSTVDRAGYTALHHAASLGYGEMVATLLEYGINVNVDLQDTYYCLTPLHHAVENKHTEVIRILLDHGAAMDLVDYYQKTPLMLAAESGDLDSCTLLLERGASPQDADELGRIIQSAAAHESSQLLELLLSRAGGQLPEKILSDALLGASLVNATILLARGANVNVVDAKTGHTPLHTAASNGSVATVSFLLDHHADPSCLDATGRSAFFLAAENGHTAVMDILLNRGAAVASVAELGDTLLHAVARNNEIPVEYIDKVYALGVELEARDISGRTAMMLAIWSKNAPAACRLLSLGADANAEDQFATTPLTEAATNGMKEVVIMLLERGADPAKEKAPGYSPFSWACQFAPEEMIKILFDHAGASVCQGKAGEKSLHSVASRGFMAFVTPLLDAGVDVNASNDEGSTVLHYATWSGDSAMIEELLKRGADTKPTTTSGDTVLHMACHAIAKGGDDPRIPALLLDYGADIHAVDKDGTSALHLAINESRFSVMKLLLERGADPNELDGHGHPALSNVCHACQDKDHGNDELIARVEEALQALLDHGANIEMINKFGRSVLGQAVAMGNTRMVRVLVERGADVNGRDQMYQTPLFHGLPYSPSPAIVGFLLDRGASVHVNDSTGVTPLVAVVAVDDSHKIDTDRITVARLLCSAGATLPPTVEIPVVASGLRAAVLHWQVCHQRGDPLTDIPTEIIQGADSSVRAYLDALQLTTADQLVHRRKVCVVGPSTWGKTSLIKSVATNAPRLVARVDRTIGIDLFPYRFTTETQTETRTETQSETQTATQTETQTETPTETQAETQSQYSSSSTSVTIKRHEVTFWDFAGQDIYHVAHSLFFSERTLFLLCVDLPAYSAECQRLAQDSSLTSLAIDSAVRRFLEHNVIQWVRKILMRQPTAEFVVVGAKKDLVSDASNVDAIVTDLQCRLGSFATELSATIRLTDVARSRLVHTLGVCHAVSVDTAGEVAMARQVIERAVVEHPEQSFVMPLLYSQVLDEVKSIKQQGAEAATAAERVDRVIQPTSLLSSALVRKIDGLQPAMCHEILHTLERLGDVLWYKNERGVFMDDVILDPTIMLDIVREVVNHNYETAEGDDYEALRRDGTLRHSLLVTFPLWQALAGTDDGEMVHMFKYLLQQFGLAYPAGNTEMHAEVDLIVPAYWASRGRASHGSRATAAAVVPPATAAATAWVDDATAVLPACVRIGWQYTVPAFVSKAVYESFVVQSYSPYLPRTVQPQRFQTHAAGEFVAAVSWVQGAGSNDSIYVDVAAVSELLAWQEMRFYVMAMEELLLRSYPALNGVHRHVVDMRSAEAVVDGEPHSVHDVVKAFKDAAAIGRDEASVRSLLPWAPPQFDWYVEQAWTDPSKLHALRMREAVVQLQHKASVVQRLVATGGDARRSLPALWTARLLADEGSLHVRMLSDVSGSCFHLPIEIPTNALTSETLESFQDGVTTLLSVVPSRYLSLDVVSNAVAMAVSATQQTGAVHHCIEDLTLTQAESHASLSPRSAMALLRQLLTVHDPEFDDLKVCELANLQCAASVSNGTYVWAHAREIEAMSDQLLACDDSAEAASVAVVVKPDDKEANGSVTLRVAKITDLRVKDWFKTYCEVELVHEASQRVDAAHRTATHADASVEPSWTDEECTVASAATLEDLAAYSLVVRVKRPSRMEKISWLRCEKKLIGEGTLALGDQLASIVASKSEIAVAVPVVGKAGTQVCTVHVELSATLVITVP